MSRGASQPRTVSMRSEVREVSAASKPQPMTQAVGWPGWGAGALAGFHALQSRTTKDGRQPRTVIIDFPAQNTSV